jgi:hypothetical protein
MEAKFTIKYLSFEQYLHASRTNDFMLETEFCTLIKLIVLNKQCE